jgi:hypothetical protein
MKFSIGNMDSSLQAASTDWESVAIVGEYTVPSGPYLDDHFLVLVFRSGETVEYPSEKARKVIPALEEVMGVKLEFGLCNITDAASRIMFPTALAEHPIFEFHESAGGIGSLLKVIRHFGVTEISKRFTKEVEDYIQSLGERIK